MRMCSGNNVLGELIAQRGWEEGVVRWLGPLVQRGLDINEPVRAPGSCFHLKSPLLAAALLRDSGQALAFLLQAGARVDAEHRSRLGDQGELMLGTQKLARSNPARSNPAQDQDEWQLLLAALEQARTGWVQHMHRDVEPRLAETGMLLPPLWTIVLQYITGEGRPFGAAHHGRISVACN
jgi:hypothetical protein